MFTRKKLPCQTFTAVYLVDRTTSVLKNVSPTQRSTFLDRRTITMAYPNDLYNSDLIHAHLFEQVQFNAQKISIELDDQSLTYAEASYYVQQIALTLLRSLENASIQNDIIYQLMERSIEMPLGMFAIFSIGGVYFALDPNNPDARLSTLIRETASHTSSEVRTFSIQSRAITRTSSVAPELSRTNFTSQCRSMRA